MPIMEKTENLPGQITIYLLLQQFVPIFLNDLVLSSCTLSKSSELDFSIGFCSLHKFCPIIYSELNTFWKVRHPLCFRYTTISAPTY